MELNPGDWPHCCLPSPSVCPGQGAAHLSDGSSPGVEVGWEGEQADGTGVLFTKYLCPESKVDFLSVAQFPSFFKMSFPFCT